MQDSFYKGTEGYLGSPENCKLLLLMREPNCGDDGTAKENSFWMKKVVDGDKLPWGNTYLSKLGTIAALVQGYRNPYDASAWSDALKHAIYINMNPVSGKGTASKEYKMALEFFQKNMHYPDQVAEQGYMNRWNAILSMPDQSVVVTVPDIYSVMKTVLFSEGMITEEGTAGHLEISTSKCRKTMRSLTFKNGDKSIHLLEAYHPAARGTVSFRYNDIELCK